MQITMSVNRLNVKWAVSLVTADAHYLPYLFVSMYGITYYINTEDV